MKFYVQKIFTLVSINGNDSCYLFCAVLYSECHYSFAIKHYWVLTLVVYISRSTFEFSLFNYSLHSRCVSGLIKWKRSHRRYCAMCWNFTLPKYIQYQSWKLKFLWKVTWYVNIKFDFLIVASKNWAKSVEVKFI